MIIIHVDFKRLVRTNPGPTLLDSSVGLEESVYRVSKESLSISVYETPTPLLVVASRARAELV